MKKFILTAVMVMAYCLTSAQTNVHVGYAPTTTNEATLWTDNVTVGIDYTMPIWKEINLSFGLDYTYGFDSDHDYQTHDITIPVAVGYNFTFDDFIVRPFIGQALTYEIYGESKWGDGTKYKFTDDDDFNPLTLDLYIGARAAYKSFTFQYAFKYNETPKFNDEYFRETAGDPIRGYGHWITIGYNF